MARNQDMNRTGSSGSARQGAMGVPDLSSFDDNLDNLTFPIDRSGILAGIRQYDLEQSVIDRIGRMPDRTYNSAEEFREAYGENMDDYGSTGASLEESDDDVSDESSWEASKSEFSGGMPDKKPSSDKRMKDKGGGGCGC